MTSPRGATAVSTLTLRRPDDWHLHLRDGAAMAAVVGPTARVFGRALVMPTLKPPVTTTAAATGYRERILRALPPDCRFQPMMTLYLTDATGEGEIAAAKASGIVLAVKYYPAGATTHSEAGVTALESTFPALAAMEKHGVVLSVHGEVTDPDVDVFDRERVFIDRSLSAIVRRFPGLKVVLEHVTTREGVQFVAAAPPTLAATITPQHLLYSRNALFAGGIRPHLYCLPVIKRETHRQALVEAATSGSPKFFLGTDSAPHARHTKETACGCAGC
jgi:dihydroorotase